MSKIYCESNKHKKFSIDEFMQLVSNNKLEFINYCEIVIDPNGYIYLCIPSHEQTLLWLSHYDSFEELVNAHPDAFISTGTLLSITKSVSVYYNIQKYVYINPVQRKVLKRLAYNGIISYNPVKY